MKLALITARYGAEIAQGPEYACRLFAEHLSSRHHVEVLTTCARDRTTWQNCYPEGTDRIRGVTVRRFAAIPASDPDVAQQAGALLNGLPTSASETEWLRNAGPWSPALMHFLARQQRQFDALVFFSWQDATTIEGIQIAPKRSILVPWVRLDPALRLSVARETLSAAGAVAYLSASERSILRLHARGRIGPDDVVGIGVHPPPQVSYPRIQQDPEDEPEVDEDDDERGVLFQDEHYKPHLAARGSLFRRRHRLDGSLVMYGGRVDSRGGCTEMLEYFDSYAAQEGNNAALVLLGTKMMKLPEMPAVAMTGVLPARERLAAFEAADMTVAPSPDDLCAESVLESLAAGAPVLANARNEAAVEHCRRSNGGLYYANREEFVEAVQTLMGSPSLRESLGQNGREYARRQCQWDAVIARFERLATAIRPR